MPMLDVSSGDLELKKGDKTFHAAPLVDFFYFLQDLQKTAEDAGGDDRAVLDKLRCWVEDNCQVMLTYEEADNIRRGVSREFLKKKLSEAGDIESMRKSLNSTASFRSD